MHLVQHSCSELTFVSLASLFLSLYSWLAILDALGLVFTCDVASFEMVDKTILIVTL